MLQGITANFSGWIRGLELPSFGERVLFIGTQFSNLYTAVDTPARGRVVHGLELPSFGDRLLQISITSCLLIRCPFPCLSSQGPSPSPFFHDPQKVATIPSHSGLVTDIIFKFLQIFRPVTNTWPINIKHNSICKGLVHVFGTNLVLSIRRISGPKSWRSWCCLLVLDTAVHTPARRMSCMHSRHSWPQNHKSTYSLNLDFKIRRD